MNQASSLLSHQVKQENFNEKDISRCRLLLQKMSANWHQNAQVKTLKEEPDAELLFDETKLDFRADLLPFKNHPYFLQAPVEIQNKILSCGWLAYNEKTINIEAKVITPACYHIIYREVPGADDEISQQIACETLVDESYHVLLVNKACGITRKQRGLNSLRLPDFNLVTYMYREQANYSEAWQKIIVQLATAFVSEVFISDYLKLLAKDRTIQPFNRMVVDAHRRDELAHSSIFKNLMKYIYSQLSEKQKEFFIEVLPKPVRWFANAELAVWKALLAQIGFPGSEQLIADCAASNEVDLMRLDYTDVTKLALELNILNSERGIDSFAREGLLN